MIAKCRKLLKKIPFLVYFVHKKRAFVQIARVFYRQLQLITQQPELNLRLLDRLPIYLSGLSYSREWQPLVVSNTSQSLSGSQTVSRSSNPLKAWFNSHTEGRGIWKPLNYFDIYHRHFKKFVGRKVHILEVGVYSGGSLEMWRDYFGPKCYVYGIDIQEGCKVYENEYTKIFIGNQADHKFWKLFKSKVPAIDILVDDGSHQAEHQRITLEEMLPCISPGGVYLCEDIGGHNKFSSYFYGLIDSLMSKMPNATSTQFQKWIKSIHFYPHVAVIERGESPEEQPTQKRGTEWQPFCEKDNK